jgi:two-component sensor histidine kinase
VNVQEPSDGNPYFELRFRPSVATIADARRFVTMLYEPLLGDADAASRVALTTHEMLENALKYSRDGHTVVRIEVSRQARPSTITVETRNRISPERKEGLEMVFEEMHRFSNATEHYQFAIQRTRNMRHGSGLGLARIWAEGEMNLSRSYSEDEVRITAVTVLNEVSP